MRDLNMELLWVNLEALRDIKDYCKRKNLPLPNLDQRLAYRVQQLLDLTETINATLGINTQNGTAFGNTQGRDTTACVVFHFLP